MISNVRKAEFAQLHFGQKSTEAYKDIKIAITKESVKIIAIGNLGAGKYSF